MKIFEKVLDLLYLRIFESIPDGNGYMLFSFQHCGDTYDDIRIGMSGISWYNESVWGYEEGKLLKKGNMEYKDCYKKFCEEWIDSFIKDIEVQLFLTPALTRYDNVYTYLKALKSKKESSNRLFDKYINDYRGLAEVCPLIFNIDGDIGDEAIRVKFDESGNNPGNMLENVSWVEDECIVFDEEENYKESMAKDFFDRLNEELDVLKVSKLFCDANVTSRKTILRNEDGTYIIKMENWNIWKSKGKDWVEKMGEIEYDTDFFSNSKVETLVISGSYEEIANMIDFLKPSEVEF